MRSIFAAHLLLIGLGGFLGAILRYVLSSAVLTLSGVLSFPLGTLTVNVVGSCAGGVLLSLIESHKVSPDLRDFLVIGLLGALTTFSTFSTETVVLLRSQQIGLALLNILLNVVLCLLAVVAGYFTVGKLT